MGKIFTFLSASVALLLSILLLPAFETTWWPLRSPTVADLVVRNATIYTSDPSLPFAEAMAIRGGRILRVGNYSSLQGEPLYPFAEVVRRDLENPAITEDMALDTKNWQNRTYRPASVCIDDLIGRGTCELNLNGKVVVPGFIDSHVHLIIGGLQMARLELRGVKSQDEFVRKVKEAVKDKHEGDWILGGGWNNNFWGGDLPVASWIDEITPNNPVWLSRMDGHMGLANSLALMISGITNNTQDPVGGTVMKTTGGEPTGLLIDSAMELLMPFIPEVSVHERRNALIRASKYALMRGVTTVIDFGRFFPGASVDLVWQDFSDVYQWADSAGKMLIRVCLFFPMQTWSHLVDLVREEGRGLSQWIYLGGVKAFADGSVGSNSALFYEPYTGEPHNCGLQVTNLDWLLNMTLASDKSGLQVAVHAIGDRANDLVLDLCNSVVHLNGMRDRRFRIEHAQHLAPGAAGRFGQQNVIASVQPEHLLDDADSAEKKIGVDRAHTGSYLFQSLLTSNAQLAFGSDWPVVDINPLGGIRSAMTRIPPGWEYSWIPSECVSLNDALNAYTISAAYASFLDSDLGSLSSGKMADFVVLSAGSWCEFTEDVSSSSVLATYTAGIKAYP